MRLSILFCLILFCAGCNPIIPFVGRNTISFGGQPPASQPILSQITDLTMVLAGLSLLLCAGLCIVWYKSARFRKGFRQLIEKGGFSEDSIKSLGNDATKKELARIRLKESLP